MRKQAASYAIVRFQPHVETGEFANVGIVLVAPRTGYLDFKLETRRLGRLTGFFDTVDTATIRSVLKNYHAELTRIRDLAGHFGDGQTRFEFDLLDNAEHLFSTLTKDREGIIRFSEVRFVMTDNPKKKLEELFDFYVKRSFASAVYKEGLLERHVRSILKLREVGQNFKRYSFDDGVYSATFPFVQLVNGRPVKILKPIYLGQEDANRILDHGNKWLFTVNRLKTRLPDNVVFAVEGPGGHSRRQQAFQDAVDRFRANDIRVVDATKERELVGAIEE